MDIQANNTNKSKTYSVAPYKISQITIDLQTLSAKNIYKINGTGDTISKKILEIIGTNSIKKLEELI